MAQIQRSALVMHSAPRMYQLVNDVASYPAFLDGCVGTKVLEQSELQMLARMDLKKAGIQLSLLTRNRLVDASKIIMTLEEGPFSDLKGEWAFTSLAEDASKISLDLRFEFSNSALRLAASALFTGVANNLVDAICRRADSLYGRGGVGD
ncbi:MAG: type II toxin-antitoxin system RatA family toxin [Porticoccaceae bacterium]|nr:type II toxin-antitoxin system RatA family toxin [Porticoccaceae bacterium]